MNTVSTSWINAISLADLRSKGKTVVRHKGKQIALFAAELGVSHATIAALMKATHCVKVRWMKTAS